jgi:hypothetical protein
MLELQVHPKPLNHMNRREFARNVVGAIFGVSAIPAFGSKPNLPWWTPAVTASSKFVQLEMGPPSCIPFGLFSAPPPDISIADKLRIRDMLG